MKSSSTAAKRPSASPFFFFKQKTAYDTRLSLVGSEMCIRDRPRDAGDLGGSSIRGHSHPGTQRNSRYGNPFPIRPTQRRENRHYSKVLGRLVLRIRAPLSTAVWVGHPEAQIVMYDVHGRRVTGGSFPAMIWQ